MIRKWLGPGAWGFALLWLLLLAGGQSRFFRDPGTFWHTVVGRKIIADGRLFTTDPYSGSHAGQPWLPHQWLGEVTMALVESATGFDGLLLLSATILALTFAPLFARLVHAGLHWLPALVLLGIGIAAASGHFHVRPHLATIAATAALACTLCNVDAGLWSVAKLYWLIPLFIVWSNCHGGALGGLATLWITLGGWGIFKVLGWPNPLNHWRTFGMGVLAAVLCTLTPLVNPVGVALPQCWLDIMGMPELKQIIQEHAPLSIRSTASWPVLGFFAVYLLVLCGLNIKPRVTWLLPLLWFALSADRIRHAPLFAVFALAAFAEMIPATRWAKKQQAQGADLFVPPTQPAPSPWGAFVLPLLLVVLAVGLQCNQVTVPVIGRGWAKLEPEVWPMDLRETLGKEPGGFTFNEYADGGFLIYFAPHFRPFVDDRCELFGGPFLMDFVNAEGDQPLLYLKRMQQKYGLFQYALTHTGSGYDLAIKSDVSNWVCVKATDTATLYKKR